MKMLFVLQYKIRTILKDFTRKKCFRKYSDIQRVVILFDLEYAEEVKDLAKSLKFAGKEVFSYAFNTASKDDGAVFPENFTILNKKDLTFTGVPIHSVMELYKAIKPDTLMDLTVHPHPVLQYLSLKSDATYRVGFHREDKTFDDLLLQYDPEQSFVFLTSQLHFYMKSIRAK